MDLSCFCTSFKLSLFWTTFSRTFVQLTALDEKECISPERRAALFTLQYNKVHLTLDEVLSALLLYIKDLVSFPIMQPTQYVYATYLCGNWGLTKQHRYWYWIPLLLLAIKSFASDPGVSCLLPMFIKLWQTNM